MILRDATGMAVRCNHVVHLAGSAVASWFHTASDTFMYCVQASVAGALSRDVIFARVAPATYCLQAIFSRHK